MPRSLQPRPTCCAPGCSRPADVEVLLYKVYPGVWDVFCNQDWDCPFLCMKHVAENETRATRLAPKPGVVPKTVFTGAELERWRDDYDVVPAGDERNPVRHKVKYPFTCRSGCMSVYYPLLDQNDEMRVATYRTPPASWFANEEDDEEDDEE